MNRFLFDTDIISDVPLNRKPHAAASVEACSAIERRVAEGAIAAHALTTISYFVRKDVGNAKAKTAIKNLLRVFEVAAVNRTVIEDSLSYPCSDFEDAITVAAVPAAACEYLVTRDSKRFRGTPLRCLTPDAAIPLLRGK